MAMNNSILFLDVDGVLNNEAVFRSRKYGPAPLCPHCVARFHRLVAETDCRIVLSSAWRGMPTLERKLSRAGIFYRAHRDKRTVGLSGSDDRRGREIAEWLGRHPEIKTYAIVDDDGDMLPEQEPFFVQTSFKTGLLDEHVSRLIAILQTRANGQHAAVKED